MVGNLLTRKYNVLLKRRDGMFTNTRVLRSAIANEYYNLFIDSIASRNVLNDP